ncbi:protein Red [Neodiprion pinetum]|uniref:Protein Red n=1 Tax=Neodiprion lecontei TaxID=441921 RepID=A0A6J0BEW4_NEOLC|nr:protein Red [Neodiprion lecontei]XP_015513369.1 protein Red [Neodiprion lecontei]XP_046417851.1 protein Red [Neodiprion fabricii]XP_046417852.1 protein Red [Neodiprion fabricii]XP_046417853.1 protein Red [Neodiprion fabricii]XP_046473074.1 protein Red [Neodiprion pinetum]XP_046473075.1 protein Red [Neodiprion pinetum]XP_046473077.1 protein Red [Neodiprion pinetum]XP_046473078.1 protein Red [Neodiprion pinetum]XP_046590753.1 protein Red [Neodiprion lecontei]XP_046611674.1 protein Red [N
MPDTMEEDMGLSVRLTNDDFRRLLMTPRASVPSSTPASVPGTMRDTAAKTAQTPVIAGGSRAELRRKKKSFYAKLKKQEEDKMAELAEKYRDRARERRDGTNADYQSEDPMNTASAYRAVAPDVKSGMDAAERRRQMIQQSKFLGGDMEHTHLVKGLDYALLQKVRSEIEAKEQEQEIEMEKLVKPKKDKEKDKKEVEKKEEEMQFKTKIGRNIHKTLAIMRSKHVERNELYCPGRMAYVIELDDENADGDIPTTLIRSKADVPTIDTTPTLTTNDIVINKLAQILSYLRQGSRHNKKGKKNREGKSRVEELNEIDTAQRPQDDSIYGDIGDYVPSSSRKEAVHSKDKKKGSYFDKPVETSTDDAANAPQLPPVIAQSIENAPKKGMLLNKLAAEPEGYAECYPGLDEMQDAIDDSDDEVDYTKMDLGNKKGPIGRWDFDTPEEYSEYMNNKEALPKAAFQYGVKMADGRRTRKYNKEKNEKAELDREWQKIQNIMNKRKPTGGSEAVPEFKVPRY